MTANPRQGWRISPAPGAQLKRTEAGRFALPMEITRDGEHVTTIEHVYTAEEIEQLHTQMRVLIAQTTPEPSPYPRGEREGALELRL